MLKPVTHCNTASCNATLFSEKAAYSFIPPFPDYVWLMHDVNNLPSNAEYLKCSNSENSLTFESYGLF